MGNRWQRSLARRGCRPIRSTSWRRVGSESAARVRSSGLLRVDGGMSKSVTEWLRTVKWPADPVLRWADVDFEIPPSLTRGRDTLEITLDASSSATPWSAYGYTVFSHVNRSAGP